ncbi:MAG: hypothetical protein LBG97_07710 [Coriobacteriales bacterium]|jgi:hypothetical protein|nr:hypothetical protein [Coriobacteriales bacterium]
MLLIPTKSLIAVAAAVWLLAGVGVVSVGVSASPTPWDTTMVVGFLITLLFFLFVFLMIARKHIRRITGYTDSMSFLFKFFDAQSYAILAVMIFLGAAVRMSGFVPGQIIGFFYTGLGIALIIAGVYYATTFVAICDNLIVEQER